MGYPVLADRFFEERRPTREFFAKWRAHSTWGPTLLPIYEWDGILFVAIAPQAIDLVRVEGDWCLVTANPERLAELWQEWEQPEAAMPALPEELAPFLSPGDESFSEDPAALLKPSSEDEDLAALMEKSAAESENPEEAEKAPAPEEPAEEGGELNFMSEDEVRMGGGVVPTETAPISLASLTRTSVPIEPANTPPSRELPPVPQPHEMKAFPPVNEDTQAPTQSAILTHAGDLTKTAGPLNLTSLTKKSEITTSTVRAPSAPPPPPPPVSRGPSSQPPPPPPKQSRPAAPQPAPASGIKRSPPANFENWETIWGKLTGTYDHAMVLLFKDGQAVPWKWDDKLAPHGLPSPLDLETPSPFRIVARTQKPYHGYLVPNPVSETLFKDWNEGHLPEHMTMAPILEEEQLLGFLVAWGKKFADTKDALLLVENSATGIATMFRRKPELLKSA